MEARQSPPPSQFVAAFEWTPLFPVYNNGIIPCPRRLQPCLIMGRLPTCFWEVMIFIVAGPFMSNFCFQERCPSSWTLYLPEKLFPFPYMPLSTLREWAERPTAPSSQITPVAVLAYEYASAGALQSWDISCQCSIPIASKVPSPERQEEKHTLLSSSLLIRWLCSISKWMQCLFPLMRSDDKRRYAPHSVTACSVAFPQLLFHR